MLRALLFYSSLFLCGLVAAEELVEQQETTPPELESKEEKKKPADDHVISHSRVFSVSGGDGLRMGAIATRADDMRAQLCRLLGLPQKRIYNISLRLIGQMSDPRVFPRMRLQVDLIGRDPSLTLLIQAGGGIDVPELNKNIISISLYEYALRDLDIEALEGKLSIPDWLLTGIQQAVFWRGGKVDRSTYENLFKKAEMLSPAEIINNERPWELDAASRQVYEASCGVLILGLLAQEGGDVRLRELVRESILHEGSLLEIIQQHFHEVGLSDNALAKWWALELANLAVPKTTEAMTPLETEERLAEALRVTYLNPETKLPERLNFDDVYSVVQLSDWKTQLLPLPQALSAMSVRCYPSYRPFIAGYIHALNLLLKNGDPAEVQDIIGPIREMRESYVIASLRVRDYLDWYEITHTGKSNQAAFTSYLDTMAMLRKEQSTAPTPISNYLRDIEDLYKLPYDKPLPDHLKKGIKK